MYVSGAHVLPITILKKQEVVLSDRRLRLRPILRDSERDSGVFAGGIIYLATSTLSLFIALGL